MSSSPILRAIQARLRKAGYSDLSTPFKLAGVDFALTGAMRGRSIWSCWSTRSPETSEIAMAPEFGSESRR